MTEQTVTATDDEVGAADLAVQMCEAMVSVARQQAQQLSGSGPDTLVREITRASILLTSLDQIAHDQDTADGLGLAAAFVMRHVVRAVAEELGVELPPVPAADDRAPEPVLA
jgi:hypothetical protein